MRQLAPLSSATFNDGTSASHRLRARVAWSAFLLVYCALLAAGSFFPFHPWPASHGLDLTFLWASWPKALAHTDVITNVLVYLPFGLLLSRVISRQRFSLIAWLLVCMAGFTFSLAMESLQGIFRYRIPSNVDITFNTLGTAIGAAIAPALSSNRRLLSWLIAFRRHQLRPGWLVGFGLLLVLSWVLSQFSLQAPSLIAGSLKAGFRPFWEASIDPTVLDWPAIAIFSLEITCIALFSAALLQPSHHSPIVITIIAIGAILLKFIAAASLVKWAIFPRLFSWEILLGLAGGLALPVVISLRDRQPPSLNTIVTLLGIFALAKLFRGLPFITASGSTPDLAEQPELLLNITGIAYLISVLWPYLALGCALGWLKDTPPERRA